MPAVLVAVLGFVVSGLVWRILASIGFGLATAGFINHVVTDYINRSLNMMGTQLHPHTAAYLNIIHADDAISIMIGAVMFVATYKSLKLIFVRK